MARHGDSDRGVRTFTDAAAAHALRRVARRADRRQGRRPRGRQGCRRRDATKATRTRRSTRCCRPARWAPPARAWSSRNSSTARRRASSSWPTALHALRARVEPGSQAACAMATAARTPAAWARIRRRPSSRRRVHARIMREVIAPAIAGMAAEGMPYTGFPVRGRDDRRQRRAARAGIQLPARRSGNAADHGAADARISPCSSITRSTGRSIASKPSGTAAPR